LNKDYSPESVIRDTIIEGKCKTFSENETKCQEIFSKPFRQLIKIGPYCELCSKEKGIMKIKETTMKNYGVTNCMKNDFIKEKQKKSMVEIYGVEHNSQLPEIKESKKQKSIDKYGVDYILQSPEIRKQICLTNIEKFGVDNPQKNKEIKDKTINTVVERYKCRTPLGDPDVLKKSRQTNMEKYGVSHHLQNAECAENHLKSTYKKKHYTFPCGKIIEYQGYENFAYDYLLKKEEILESDIITSRKEVPEIWYEDKEGKQRRHYVDIYIKSQNRCIEVKSIWTIQDKNSVFEKQKAALNLGYEYEIWVYDRYGTRINVYL